MDEHVEMPASALAGLIQQLRAIGFEPLHRRREIRNLERHVMQPLAALVDKFRDHRLGSSGLQQFDARFAHREHRDVNFFVFHGLAMADRAAELLLVEAERGIQRLYRDAEMINA